MKNSASTVVVLICLVILGYVWREPIKIWVAKYKKPAPAVQEEEPQLPCEINGMTCPDLVRMLNATRSGRYYEVAGKLLGVTEESDIKREGPAMVFTLPDGRIVMHNQGVATREKGYLTVIFKDQRQIKFDDNGQFVSQE